METHLERQRRMLQDPIRGALRSHVGALVSRVEGPRSEGNEIAVAVRCITDVVWRVGRVAPDVIASLTSDNKVVGVHS